MVLNLDESCESYEPHVRIVPCTSFWLEIPHPFHEEWFAIKFLQVVSKFYNQIMEFLL